MAFTNCDTEFLGVADPCASDKFQTGLLATQTGVHGIMLQEANSSALHEYAIYFLSGQEIFIPLSEVNERTQAVCWFIQPDGSRYAAFFAETFTEDPEAIKFRFDTKQIKT